MKKSLSTVVVAITICFAWAFGPGSAQASASPKQINLSPGLVNTEILEMVSSVENISPEMASLLLPEKGSKQVISAGLSDVPLGAGSFAQDPSLSVTWSGATQWLTGINWGGSYYFGSMDLGKNFFGSNITSDQYVPVELRFSSVPAEQTLCMTFDRGLGYPPSGVGSFPGSAWDMSDPANPRRLNIGFVEWTGGNPPPNHQWDPNGTGSPVFGNREYLFIFNSDYDGTGLTYNTTNILNDNPDVLYSWWPFVPSGSSFFDNEPASITITPHYITNLYAIPSPTELLLSWNLVLDSAAYFLLYTGSASPANTLLDSLDASVSSFLHTGLTTGVPNFYRVEAYGASSPVVTCCVTPGDADNDGAFNIGDVTFLIARIFSGGIAPPCEDEADADGSGMVNIADVTYGIARIFSGGPAPNPCPTSVAAPLLTSSAEISATPQTVSQNVNLLGAWNKRSNYGDCWGYIEQGTNHEYALICARNEGVSIIDIEATPPVEVGFIPSISPGTDAKDVKIYLNYAIVIKESEAVQIVDLTDVTNPVQVSTIQPNGGSGAHNCLVDGSTLYIVGNHGTGGLEVFDISTPSAPVRIGTGFEPFYYHDIDVRNDTMYATGINGNGVDILDVSNKSAISRLGLFNYAGSGVHNAEFLGTTDYVAIGDEIGSAGNHVRIFDVADISNVTKVFDLDVNPAAVAHNCYEKGGLLYIAYYTEGLRVWDVNDPTAPFEIGFYDTEPSGANGFNGAWNVFPYYPSGKIIVSDFSTGLYVLQNAP